jgi:hypothetical protein
MDDVCRLPSAPASLKVVLSGTEAWVHAFSLSMPGIRPILARNHAIMQLRNQADLSGRSYEGSHEAHTP